MTRIFPSKANAYLHLIGTLMANAGFTQAQVKESQSTLRNWIVDVIHSTLQPQDFDQSKRNSWGDILIERLSQLHVKVLEVPPGFEDRLTNLFKDYVQTCYFLPEEVPEFPIDVAIMVVALIQLNTTPADAS